MWHDVVVFIAEDNATKPNDFGAFRDWGSGILATAHGPEEANDCEFSSNECDKIVGCWATNTGGYEHEPGELGVVAFCRWIGGSMLM